MNTDATPPKPGGRRPATGSPLDASPTSLWRFASGGVFWSLVQSWGARAATFLISVVLARLLTPTEFGIASMALLVLNFVPQIAEFGFGGAIVQRPNLKRKEVNLPFYASCALGVALVAAVAAGAERIEDWAGVDEVALFIVLSSATVLLRVPTAFQEAMYKRNMRFKALALRRLTADTAAGMLAVVAAVAGLGAWALLVQAYAHSIINAVWLWLRPEWLPSRRFDGRSFVRMSRFGLPIVFQRVNDIVGSRLIDFLIIGGIGVTAFGFYALGSRMFILMRELLQGTLYDVSLSVLSRVASDRARLAEAYLKTVSVASHVMSPILVMLAALSPEICDFLFGAKWDGVDEIMAPLMLLGALQAVQNMNGIFLTARGRPAVVLVTGVFKTAVTVAGLLLIPTEDVEIMTIVFCVAQAASAPISFWTVWRELGHSLNALTHTLAQSAILSAVSYMAVQIVRPALTLDPSLVLVQGMLLGGVFALVFGGLLAVVDRGKLRLFRDLMSGGLKRGAGGRL